MLTGELRIQPDAGAVVFASASLRFDSDLGDELDLLGVTVPAFQVVDGVAVFPILLDPGGTTESTGASLGEVLGCQQSGDLLGSPNPTATEFVLCEVQFEVTGNVASDGADIEIGLFFTGYDSINDDANDAQTSLPVTPVAGVDGP